MFSWMVLLVPFLLIKQLSFHKIIISLFFLYIYFVFCTLIYNPLAFLDPLFYRRDGNFFITFLPLMILGLLQLRINVEKIVIYFVRFSTLVNFSLIFVYLFTGFYINKDFQLEITDIYNLLFIAHNAAGGFLGTLVGLSIGLWWINRNWINFWMMVINCVGLLLTDSRGTVLGLLGALVIHFIFKEKHIKKIIFVYLSLFALIMSFSYPIWDDIDHPHASFELNVNRGTTILIRLIELWPPAIYLWLHSPYLGTGFGSYNDSPYELVGVPHLFQINNSNNFVYSDGHAHHSFLHIMAETGLVGLFLVIIFLYYVWRFIQGLESERLKCGLLLVFWTAIWSSVTEHRLFTPSQMLPFTIILGLVLGNERAVETIKIRSKKIFRTI
jgi:O-antigen ligase